MTIQKKNSRQPVWPGGIFRGVLILVLGAWKISVADTITVWQEDFHLISPGSRPADWIIKAEPLSACQVVGMPGATGKVLKLNTLLSDSTLFAERQFSSCSGFITMEWRFFESESGKGQTFIVEDDSGKALLRLFAGPAGALCLNDSLRVVQPGIVANQWYKVTFLLWTTTMRSDLYINDIPVSSEVAFLSPGNRIAGIRICAAVTSPGILHVTDFRVSSVNMFPERTVRIYSERERQKVDGAGFCHEGNYARKKPYIIDELIQGMLDNNMSLFRDRFPGKVWEPVNDNNDPSTMVMENFATGDSGVLTTLQRLKEMHKRGITTILGIWDVADWMVANPKNRIAREINNMDEFAESITAFLRYGKEKYDLSVNFVDVNETDMAGIHIRLTPSEYGTFIKKCGTLFRRYNLKTKINIGSTLKWAVPYVSEMVSDSGVRRVGGYPSYHSYRGTGSEPNDNSTFIEWGEFRQKLDRNLWCTETDYDAYYWENPERKQYRGVTEMAYNYWRVFYLARSSTSAGWFWRPDYPSHEVHRAYMQFFRPGGTIIDASQSYPGIFTVAYQHHGENTFVLQVLNASSRGGPVTFTGVPNQPLTLVRTNEAGDRFTTVGIYTPVNHQVSIDITGNSFNTLHGALTRKKGH